MYYDKNNFNLISIRIQKFVFLFLFFFSINIFCVIGIATNRFKVLSFFSISMGARLVNNFFLIYGIRVPITVVSGAYT